MNKPAKIIVGVIVLALVVWGIVAGTHRQSDETSNKFTIGVSNIMTGPVAFAGEGYMTGLEAAKKKINAEGGINGKELDIIYEDNANEAKASLSSFDKLRSEHPDMYVIMGSVPASAISPVADQAGIPLFVSVSFSNTAAKFANQVSFYPTASADAAATVQAMTLNKVSKVSVLYLNSDHGISELASFKSLAAGNGISIVSEENFLATDTNFNTQISKVLAAKPQAVFVIAINSLPVIKQLKTFRSGVAIYTNNPAVSGSLIYKDPATYDDVYLAGYRSTIPGTAEYAAIRNILATSSPTDTLGYAAAGYDNMLAIAGVLKKNPDPSQFVKTFSTYGSFSGINGTFDLSGRDVSIPLYPVLFKNGILSEVK